jgi:hypothetical protein
MSQAPTTIEDSRILVEILPTCYLPNSDTAHIVKFLKFGLARRDLQVRTFRIARGQASITDEVVSSPAVESPNGRVGKTKSLENEVSYSCSKRV